MQKVLVVDDDPDVAHVLAALLRHCGCDTRTVGDAPSAIDEVSSYQPDVVLFDVGLAQQSRAYLIEQLRRESGSRQLRIVALAGSTAEQNDLLEPVFDGCLQKPVDLTTLREVVAC